jgi:uncharacterized membrane protein YecN with MAPEG domain
MSLHITLLYAGLAGLLLVILSFNVMQNWVRVTGQGHETDLLEPKEQQTVIVHALGAMLIAGRILHAYGSNDIPAAGFMRFIGAQMTFLMLAITSMACLYYYGVG